MERPKFGLGQVVMTPGVGSLTMTADELLALILRHVSGDWGDTCPEDARANEAALTHGDRIVSVYHHRGTKLYIITEADRSATTFLLPEEY